MTDLASILLVIVTIVYSYLTYKIFKSNELTVKELQRQNELLIRPYITINTFLTHGAIYYLRIKNTGKSAAFNLKMTMDKNFFMAGIKNENRNIKDAYIFNNIIEVFPPESELFFYLGHGSVLLGNKYDEKITPQEFTITASYSFNNKTFSEKTTINLKQYGDTIIYTDSMVSFLKKISENLKNISKYIKELKQK